MKSLAHCGAHASKSTGTGPVRDVLIRSGCVVQFRDTFTAFSNVEEFQFDGVEVTFVALFSRQIAQHSSAGAVGNPPPSVVTGVVADAK